MKDYITFGLAIAGSLLIELLPVLAFVLIAVALVIQLWPRKVRR